MFDFQDSSIRFTGRWASYNGAMTTTAPGAYIEIAFQGDWIRLHFDITENEHPYPHVYFQLDDGCRTEVPIERWLRIDCTQGDHVLKVIFKSAREGQARFFQPLVGKLSFLGYEAENAGVLSPDDRKIIEFVGDSITEGVLIDDHLVLPGTMDHENRTYQDDVTAGYAWLTAEALNLRPVFMGYGGVGTTQPGCGGVPKAADAYPWCFEGAPISHRPDYILINHGTNDQIAGAQKLMEEYAGLLDVVREYQSQATIICVSPFYSVYAKEVERVVQAYNLTHGTHIHYICGADLVSREPAHPRRDGHGVLARYLCGKLKTILNK